MPDQNKKAPADLSRIDEHSHEAKPPAPAESTIVAHLPRTRLFTGDQTENGLRFIIDPDKDFWSVVAKHDHGAD